MSTPLKIYVASSWRNESQPTVVKALREQDHQVYDFRNPQSPEEIEAGSPTNRNGFAWADIDSNWENWSAREFRDALDDGRAVVGFDFDMAALRWADVVVLLMPCGRSAHLEVGYACGAQKEVIIYLDGGEPELMYRMAGHVVVDERELVQVLSGLQGAREQSVALKSELMED